jgi:hypothetical protein
VKMIWYIIIVFLGEVMYFMTSLTEKTL